MLTLDLLPSKSPCLVAKSSKLPYKDCFYWLKSKMRITDILVHNLHLVFFSYTCIIPFYSSCNIFRDITFLYLMFSLKFFSLFLKKILVLSCLWNVYFVIIQLCLQLEIWGDPMLNHSLDIRVPPQAYSYITRCFTYYRIKWKVEIPDLQR